MWNEFADRETCIDALAGDIVREIDERLKVADAFRLCVSGGRSPIPLFKTLGQRPLAWARVQVRLVDERYVPPDHPDSNEGLLRRHLLKGPAHAADFTGLYIAGASPAEAAVIANRDARAIDLVLLGMGEDGHTASLFAGAVQLEEALRPEAHYYVHVSPPHAAHERITLSLAALRAARRRILYISGAKKRAILLEAEKKRCEQLPVSLLAADPGVSLDVYWHP